MIIKKSESKKHVNSPNCIAHEYDTGKKEVNISFIEIKGRYPDKGRVVNKVCKEIIFVVSGKGKIEVDNKKFLVNKEDLVFINSNQKYFLDGKMKIVVCCQPSWYPRQHVECD